MTGGLGMKFLGSALAVVVTAGVLVLATGMVMDMMESDRFWHRVKPQVGN